MTLFTQQVFGMIMVEIIQICSSGNTTMKSLCIFSLGCRSTAISFVTLRNRFLRKLVFARIIFVFVLIFRNFVVYWQICKNLSQWNLIFFFYPWKWIHSKLLLSSLFDVVLILKESNSTVWWSEFRTLLIDGFHFR